MSPDKPNLKHGSILPYTRLSRRAYQCPVRRDLMDEIDWNDRLIGIKGTRGVGKTTFLLQYAKEKFGTDRSCLFINMNNFYFSGHGIVEFAAEFQRRGGKVLLIDQVFKYPEWSKELRMCYDRFPNLKIVFTGSSVMRLKEENMELRDIVKSYNLRGFSFREYLNLQTGMKFHAYPLEEILSNHEQIAKGILSKVRPLTTCRTICTTASTLSSSKSVTSRRICSRQ